MKGLTFDLPSKGTTKMDSTIRVDTATENIQMLYFPNQTSFLSKIWAGGTIKRLLSKKKFLFKSFPNSLCEVINSEKQQKEIK